VELCALLGRPAITAQEIAAIVREVACSLSTPCQALLHPNLFGQLGKLEGEYCIRLSDGAVPYQISNSYHVALPLLPTVKTELSQMLKDVVISEVNEPTDWCAGMVVVPKKNSKIRICVDNTKRNAWVKREKRPLPHVDNLLGQLAGAKYLQNGR